MCKYCFEYLSMSDIFCIFVSDYQIVKYEQRQEN